MSNGLMTGVTGLRAHQQMLDVAGNNLANVNTYGYKAGRVGFAEQLAQTIRGATEPSATVGGSAGGTRYWYPTNELSIHTITSGPSGNTQRTWVE